MGRANYLAILDISHSCHGHILSDDSTNYLISRETMAKLPIVPLHHHVRLLKAELQAIEDALPPVPVKEKALQEKPTPRMIWYGVPID